MQIVKSFQESLKGEPASQQPPVDREIQETITMDRIITETVSITKPVDQKETASAPTEACADPLSLPTIIGFVMLTSTIATALECVWLTTLARMTWMMAFGNTAILVLWIVGLLLGWNTVVSMIDVSAGYSRQVVRIAYRGVASQYYQPVY